MVTGDAWTSSCMGPRRAEGHFAATPTLVSPLRADGAGGCCQGRRCPATRSPQKRAALPRAAGGVAPPPRRVDMRGWWLVGLRGGRAREAVRPAPRPTRAACAARLSAGRMEAPLVGHPGRRATEGADLRPAWRATPVMPAAETRPPLVHVLPRDGPLGPSGVVLRG